MWSKWRSSKSGKLVDDTNDVDDVNVDDVNVDVDDDTNDDDVVDIDDYGIVDIDAVDAESSGETERHPAGPNNSTSELRLAAAFSAIAVVALAAVVGWCGYGFLRSHQAEQERDLYLQVARQGAVDLSSIDFAEVDADVQRILDSSTGTFHDDFKKQSTAFVDLVKRDQSKTQGAVTEAGLQESTADSARALVSIAVTTTTAATPEPSVKNFRLRVDVQKVGEAVKVSNVQFIP